MTRARETVLVGSRFRVDRIAIPKSDGTTTTRELVVHPGAVVVLPILDDGRIVLIRNTRPMLERTLVELPAGTREAGEEPIVTARRELEEETGYVAAHLEPLLEFYASPGITDERMYAFVATGLRKTAQHLDPTERIDVAPTSLDDALALCRDGVIEDGKTIAVLLHHHVFGARPREQTPPQSTP
jgi:ADP-ribose pyrophosphatase